MILVDTFHPLWRFVKKKEEKNYVNKSFHPLWHWRVPGYKNCTKKRKRKLVWTLEVSESD